MKMQELKALSKDDLKAKAKSLKEELFKMNMQRYTGNVEKPHNFKAIRKDNARIQTLLNKKETK